MSRIHSNNYATTLNGAILAAATSIVVNSVTQLPVIGGGVYCNITLQNGNDIEIVKATSNSGTTLTVVRAQEGTSALNFADGSIVSLRPTADSVDRKEDLVSGRALTSVSPATDDKMLIQDTSDSDNLKTVLVSAVVALAGGGGSGFTRANISGTTQAAAIDTYYIVSNSSATTVTLPATAAIGSVISLQGAGAGGWILAANTGQTIKLLGSTTSSAGNLASTQQYDSIEVMCIVANTTWSVRSGSSAGYTIS